MVNPNDPNSESGGIPPSEPGSDPSSAQSADSGPISDELFDSLSELLGDTPTNDEPASLPDLDSWSEEPTESPSVPDELGATLDDTTLIQMGPDVETPPLEELSAIGDSLDSAADPTDIPVISEDEGTQPLDAWTDTPSDSGSSVFGDVDDLTSEVSELPDPSVPDIAAAASTDSADILFDPFAASSGEPPVDLTPEVSEPLDSSIPDIAAASTDSADILSDPFAIPSGELPVDLTPEIGEPSDPSLPDIAATTSAGDTLSDPWTETVSEEQLPITPLNAEIEDPTQIQPPEVPTISEPVEEPISLGSTPDDSPLPDPWGDNVEPAGAETLTPETTDFSGSDIPPGVDPAPDFTADVSASAEVPVEPEIEERSFPDDQPLTVGEDAPLSVDAPSPMSEDLPVADSPLPIDTGAIPGSEATPLVASSGFISSDMETDMEDVSTGDAGVDPNVPVEPEEGAAAEIPAVIPPLGGVTGDSASMPEADGLESIPTSDSPSDVTSAPEPDPMPAPEPVAVGSASSARASSGANAGDLGALSDKLPLNRVQAVGLLVAMSTLGTITYFGVTGNQQEPSQAPTSAPSVSSSPLNPNPSANSPAGGSPIASAPSASGDAANGGETANTPGQTPTNQTAAVPQSPTEAIGGLDAPEVIPSQLDISDVPEDHWAYPFIAKLHAQGIIPDYPDGKFQPDKPVTRAELAAQIQRAFVDEPGQRTLTFSDIASDYWAADAIEGAVDKKFMSGYPEGDFQPDKLVPRYEVLVALVSGLELEIPTSPDSSLQRFQDQGQLPDWSKGQIAASTQESIVVSHPEPGLLKPEANATRAEVAAMIYQSLVQSGRLEPIESEYVVTPDS